MVLCETPRDRRAQSVPDWRWRKTRAGHGGPGARFTTISQCESALTLLRQLSDVAR